MGTVLDFGGESREAVIQALRRVVAGRNVKVLVLPNDDEGDLTYREVDGTLDDALASLVAGEVCSVQVEGVEGAPILAGIYRPKFSGGSLRDWSGSAEGLGDQATNLFDLIKEVAGLGYAALSKDESPDFEAEHITVETFPWSDWRLVRGAVRGNDGVWSERTSEV